jgi:hypothetical protein
METTVLQAKLDSLATDLKAHIREMLLASLLSLIPQYLKDSLIIFKKLKSQQ